MSDVVCFVADEALTEDIARVLCSPENPDIKIARDGGLIPMWKAKLSQAEAVIALLKRRAR